ncbi:ERF family protein [Bradyrhizobium sp.]
MTTAQPELPMKDITPPKEGISDRDKSRRGAALADARSREKKESKAAKKDRLKAEAMVKPKKANTAVATVDAAPKEAKNVLAIIADAASNPAVNPENMRALLDMQKEIMAEQSRRDFNAAFIALQADLSHVAIRQDGKIEIRKKDGSGERTGAVQQATPYATFPAIMKVIQPLLTKHGFALSFSTEPIGERLLVRGYLDGHGHQRTTAFPLPAETSGSKNNVQGWGSSQSYGRRYCAMALLNIISSAPQDADTDGHTGNFKNAKDGGFAEVPDQVEKISPDQEVKLRELVEWCGVPQKKFLDHYGIAKVTDLPADLFDAAKKACEDFHSNQKAKAARG